jgi:hypothetical protein
MTARATAERHAQDVVDGNMGRIMGDFAGSAFTQLMGTGGPPQPTTKWEILTETPAGDLFEFEVRYSNDAGDALELQTTWKQFDGGVWKIVDARKAGA